MFALDPAFHAGADPIGELALSHTRLMLDARYPWIVLIPRRPDIREFEDLEHADRHALLDEMISCGAAVRAIAEALGDPIHKLNVGQLGNITPQLHVHVLGRRVGDAAWPGPVWGHGPSQPYGEEARALALTTARHSLGL